MPTVKETRKEEQTNSIQIRYRSHNELYYTMKLFWPFHVCSVGYEEEEDKEQQEKCNQLCSLNVTIER